MMDDYSIIIARESEIAQLRLELAQANQQLAAVYRAGFKDGSALHNYIPPEVTKEILRVWDHGDIKHPGEEWKKILPHVHMQHAHKHREDFTVRGIEREEESGCHNIAHGIVRDMMALAQFMGAVPMVHKEDV